MSTQIKKNGNWVTVAGGTRMWVGTKAALQAALDAGELIDGTAVMVTDDYEENKAVRRGIWSLSQPTALAQTVEQQITFDEPMPDANYVVNLEINGYVGANQLEPYITNRTANGFKVLVWFEPSQIDPPTAVVHGNYTAFKVD